MRRVFCILISLLLMCGCSINSNSRPQPEESKPPYVPPEGELGELTVYSFKAGKADSHLISCSDFAVLIDCGEKGFGKEIVSYLESHGIKELDMLIITHFDKDHVGGAAKLLKEVPVKRVVQGSFIKESDEYSSYVRQLSELGISPETPRVRLSTRLGNAEITVYPPMQEVYKEDSSNNSSLMTSVRYGKKTLLFAADAEDARLSDFVRTEHITCDYLKVPYHGHYQTRLGMFLQAVSPQIAVITSSDEEPEDSRTMKLLSETGAVVYLTRTAPVVAKCNGESISAYYDE